MAEIGKHFRDNLNLIHVVATEGLGELVAMDVLRKRDNQPSVLLAHVWQDGDEIHIAPLAEMLGPDDLENFYPPREEGGYYLNQEITTPPKVHD